jgi:hypothetical protein
MAGDQHTNKPLFGTGEGGLGSAAASFALASASTSVSAVPDSAARAFNELLYVGQPEHAVDPPVPSHRPSPGHVPAMTAAALLRARGLRGTGVPGLDVGVAPSAAGPLALGGSAGEAVRLIDMSEEGRGTRRDLR